MPKGKQIGHKASVERPNSFIKKSIITLLGIGFLLYPLVCFSSYIIHLKDGREVVTDQYWEEEDQIKFKQYGGVMGIQKGLVREIKEVKTAEEPPEKKETPSEPETAGAGAETGKKEKTEEGAAKADASKQKGAEEAEKAEGKEQEKEKAVEVTEEEKKKAEQEKTAKIEVILEEKRQILAERNIVYLKFKEAKALNDKGEKQRLRRVLLQIQGKLSNLRDSVKAEHQGNLPTWWDRVK